MSGFLDKIKIIGFKDSTESSIAIPFSIYIGMFNPEKYSVANSYLYDDVRTPGSTAAVLQFNRIGPRTFNFDFLIFNLYFNYLFKNKVFLYKIQI